MAIISRDKGSGKKEWRAVVAWYDLSKKRHNKSSKWFSSKKDAAQAEMEIKAKTAQLSMPTTFGEVCLQWIEATPGAPRTHSDKMQIYSSYLQPICSMHLESITPPVIRKLLSSESIERLSTSRKNRIRGMISSTFKFAMATYNYDRNPCDGVPTFSKTTNERLRQNVVYDVPEFKKMVAAIPTTQKIYADVLTFLFLTGMRMNECLSLTFSDFANNKIHVWRQYSPYSKSWEVLKTAGSERWIALDRTCVGIIKEQRTAYKNMPKFNTDWFIFGGYKQVSSTTLHRVMNDAQKAAGLPHCRLHDLRHAHASILLDRMRGDGDLLKVSQRLGHSSVTTTMEIYAHVLQRNEDDIISVLEDEFSI